MSTSYISADDFLIGILGDPVDFEAPGLGLVQLRGLTVGEVAEINRKAKGDRALTLAYSVATGMVQPEMTVEQLLRAPAAMWLKYELIGVRIAELSGLSDDRETLDDFPGGGS